MTMLVTLNNLNIKSDIEAFATIGLHLVTQGDKSRGNSGCSYRGNEYPSMDEDEFESTLDLYSREYWDGKSCAVGCLIKDNIYSPEIEELTVIDEVVLDYVKRSNPDWEINQRSVYILNGFQNIHDNIEPNQWPLYIKAFYDMNFGRYNRAHALSENLYKKFLESPLTAQETIEVMEVVIGNYFLNNTVDTDTIGDVKAIYVDWVTTYLWGVFDKIETITNVSN
jgi:hypothetical protein